MEPAFECRRDRDERKRLRATDSYDVAKDGRILALVTSQERAFRPLMLVQHWTAALDQK